MRLTELASDLEALRADIADELLAINRYEQQTFTLTDEETRECVARILDERDYGDIAADLGCYDLVVRQRVSRALKTLRSKLEAHP